ncbi:leucyl aminopeptidase [Trichothermofontia sichuanensis B231]|uniref:leucyl aminopeptidase n=1 Tax=Trichothermofontia sichuanensis TaxID=3045816 RepID=UPI0022467509|nr:leucyl aminopeptidase [Trichothermofontia sichuanensis]UZQ55508.1 leucyl aminopeptidase [Trichothermofontia sichuanensis B231]
MKFHTVETAPQDWRGDGLAIGLWQTATTEDQDPPIALANEWAALDTQFNGALTELITEMEFKAKAGSTIVTRLGGNAPIRKLILVGMGKVADLTLDWVRRAAAAVARLARKERCKTLALCLPLGDLNPSLAVQAMTEGIELALYQDLRFKSEPEKVPSPERIDFLGYGDQLAAIARAQAICAGVQLARELVAAPANVVTPLTLAQTAQEIAETAGWQVEVLGKAECEQLGMGAYLGVAQASDLPPQFIHLSYQPSGTPRRKLAIIGKGLTFDSGGLNIKGAGSGIEMMKIDMAGAGAMLGAAKALSLLNPPDVELHFISPATENMISGHALHPGDVVTASNGKTIEVNNTDAEGRLTLADALVFAEKLGVDAIVDLATLTGACVIALGDQMAGLWSSDAALSEALQQAATQAGEKLWPMPLEEKYFEGMKSQIADMKNTGPRNAGAITAALFLKQFVKDTPWAHLDIAGPAWLEKEDGYNSAGATGFGVRTLVNWVLS